jgi:pyruvate/2-oxoglutarate dehydrogenase complex dihydrolipoamide acyltransferase (E2) component
VAGNYPGNVATLGTNLAVCGSQVYVIDKVLIPAGSLDAIPAVTGGLDPADASGLPGSPLAAPTPAPSPAAVAASPAATPASAPPAEEAAAGGQLEGVALATGYLRGCAVQLSSAGGAAQVL